MPITNPQELREHLELAIAVELSTVPPYLYAMYSIEDQACDAALLIRSVVAEEMLHAALATNLLLAVGGSPDFASTALMPSYPENLPHHRPPLTLNLKGCSRQQIEELFLVIEQPEVHEAVAVGDDYTSLGQFYHALERGMLEMADDFDLFANPQLERQMARHSYYAPVTFDADESGGLEPIDGIDAAREAIHVIVHQGEGVSDEKWADPAHKELTHYYKFRRIVDGESPMGDVRPVPVNPRAAGYPAAIRAVADLFNAAYRFAYLTMDEIFSAGGDRDAAVGRLYAVMAEVMSPVGHYLTEMSLGDGVAAPTFEIYDFGDNDPKAHIAAVAGEVAELHPQLSGAAQAAAAL